MMTYFRSRPHVPVQLALGVALALGSAACDRVLWQDVLDQIHHDHEPPQPPIANPCATIDCVPGYQCVVAKSNPPQASCIPVDPQPNPCTTLKCAPGFECVVQESYPPRAACVPSKDPPPVQTCGSSAQCPAGLICSTELGDCKRSPGCKPNGPCDTACYGECVKKEMPPPPPPPDRCTSSQQCGPGQQCSTERGDCLPCGAGSGIACPAVCFGVCEPAKPVPPGQCKVDSDCRATSNYCGSSPCTCVARSIYEPEPLCPVSQVACLVDPCLNKKAVCDAGKCTLAGGTPTACGEVQVMGGETSCKPADVWKKYATDACAQQMQQVGEFSVGGGDCEGGTRYVKFTCCPAGR